METSVDRVEMPELRELTLVEIVLTVLESVLIEVWRADTSDDTVPREVVIELTFVVNVPTAVLSDATDDWSEVTSLLSVVQPVTSVATDLPIAVTFVPIPESAVEETTPPLTVKEPMFEAENAGVLVVLVTAAPTR